MLLLELDAHPKASKGQLISWYQQYHKAPQFTDWLVEVITSDSYALQRNGSWLIKKHVEQKGLLTGSQYYRIAQKCSAFEQWETILHLCQSLAENPPLFPETVPYLHLFLVNHSAHKKPFVRAWAITALHELAKSFPDMREDAIRAVQTAVNDPAKSVQARIRNLK